MYEKESLLFLLLLIVFRLAAQTDSLQVRDAIGDLNSSAVKKGDFPGFILLPGEKTSIGFGGFIRTIVYFDSHKENKSNTITPGFFNPMDNNGQFGISAQLSRFLFDARAKLPQGNLRGYFEVDFTNGGFNIRHAFANWRHGKHEILAGQFWNALMDLSALSYIEGTGEPSISGVIFNRQAQVRYTYYLNAKWKFQASIEDPSSSDALIPAGFKPFTVAPDIIAAIGVSDPKIQTPRSMGTHAQAPAPKRQITAFVNRAPYRLFRPLDSGHGLWPWALARDGVPREGKSSRGRPERSAAKSKGDEVGAPGSARGDPLAGPLFR